MLIPDKLDPEREQVAEAWGKRNGRVIRLGRFWESPALDASSVRVYGNDTFCLVLAQILKLKLVTPDDDLPLKVPTEYLRRKIVQSFVESASRIEYPCFVKSLVPKLFPSKVYHSARDFHSVADGLEPNTPILVSEIVSIRSEVRSFILNNEVVTLNAYEGKADLNEARIFLKDFLANASLTLPKTFVLDLAKLYDGSWVFLEANATWGAGLNGCDPDRVVECIRATVE